MKDVGRGEKKSRGMKEGGRVREGERQDGSGEALISECQVDSILGKLKSSFQGSRENGGKVLRV